MQKTVVLLLGILAVVYLLNPGAGIVEVFPDNLPIIGNLDEAAAMGILLYCLKYFGVDLTQVFLRK